MIVALDEGIRRDLLRAAEAENTGDVRWYSDRLCSISTFSHYLGDEILAGTDSFLNPDLNPSVNPMVAVLSAAPVLHQHLQPVPRRRDPGGCGSHRKPGP